MGAIILMLARHPQMIMAENVMEFRKTSAGMITLELSSSDRIAGFQFSINARGGIALRSFETTERMSAVGMSIYQYAKDDSTLNVVILAPVRSSLPAGQGTIGTIAFSFNGSATADTARVFLSRVVICNVDAQYLNVTTGDLAWDVQESNNSRASDFTLEQNFPNPFNPSTTIAYKLETPANVRLIIYDIAGREVNTLVNQYQLAGRYSVRWDVGREGGMKLASGMYLARLQVGDQVAMMKMIYAK